MRMQHALVSSYKYGACQLFAGMLENRYRDLRISSGTMPIMRRLTTRGVMADLIGDSRARQHDMKIRGIDINRRCGHRGLPSNGRWLVLTAHGLVTWRALLAA